MDENTSILFLFQSLPTGYRELAEQCYADAIASAHQGPPDNGKDLCDALANAFDWNETKAGYKFWNDVYAWADDAKACSLPPLPNRDETSADPTIATLTRKLEQLQAEAAVTQAVLDRLQVTVPMLLNEAMAQARTRTHFKVRNVVQPQLNPQFLP